VSTSGSFRLEATGKEKNPSSEGVNQTEVHQSKGVVSEVELGGVPWRGGEYRVSCEEDLCLKKKGGLEKGGIGEGKEGAEKKGDAAQGTR